MTEEELARLERIEGQVLAIGLTLNLLIEIHTDPPGLRGAILSRLERMHARLLASHVPDAVRESAEKFVHQWIAKPPATDSQDPGSTSTEPQ